MRYQRLPAETFPFKARCYECGIGEVFVSASFSVYCPNPRCEKRVPGFYLCFVDPDERSGKKEFQRAMTENGYEWKERE